MCSMAVGVSRGPVLDGVVDGGYWTASVGRRLVSLDEEPSSDQLPVAVTFREFHSGFANPSPASGNRTEMLIREAPAFWPDSGVEDSDDNVGAVVRFGPEPALVSEPQKLRGASGVEVSALVLDHGED